MARETARRPTRINTRLIKRSENFVEFPISALEAIARMRRCLDELERKAVESARAKGATWSEIAEAVGVTRQAMYQKFRQRPDSDGG